MILKNKINTIQLGNSDLKFNFFSNGDIFDISYHDRQINLVKGNMIDGSLVNIYLRVIDNNQYRYQRLIGSNSTFKIENNQAIYQGSFEDIFYQVIFSIDGLKWYFTINLKSDTKKKIDIFYGQDIAINHKNAVLSSEAYTVQYIDYKVFENEFGYTLAAKQNQGANQYLQIGSFNSTRGYVTDGFQFFGLDYKENCQINALNNELLESKIYQYEFAYFVLQTNTLELSENFVQVQFYGLYEPNFEGIIENQVHIEKLEIPLIFNKEVVEKKAKPLLNVMNQLNGNSVDYPFLVKNYEVIEHLEQDGQKILSFFTSNFHHVVLKEKELLVERPHGHLMIHGDIMNASENVMATTNFMFGLFNSHVVLGNTSFNKFLGDLRNPLNLQKISGQRIYVKVNDSYQILGLPSYYEIGAGVTKWVYVLDNDILSVSTFVNINKNQQTLLIESMNQNSYDFIVTNQILMGVNEYSYDIDLDIKDNIITFYPPKESMMINKYSDLKYQMFSHENFKLLDEQALFGFENQYGLLSFSFTNQKQVTIYTQATFDQQFLPFEYINIFDADHQSTKFFKSFLKYLDINHINSKTNLKQLIHLSFWYTHNALTHYSSPHGLEQSNGAAWGTRDVCQGPIEFFSAAQRFDIVKNILLKVYQRQFVENGDFPQWYMFDKYYQIQAHESHGDVIVWPLRSLAYYLENTNDLSILDEKIEMMNMSTNEFSEKTTLFEHVKIQIDAIKKSFIPNTSLPRYGGGDWDDTLQPANHDLTNKMVSGWTVALLYEAISKFSEEIKTYDLDYSNQLLKLSISIKNDYEKYIILDDIPAGFVVFDEEIKYLLHPKDNQTNMKYRLLPFTRSLISEIADHNKVELYHDIIAKVFKHPDGVRLMDKAVQYNGGKKTYFTRAETAANFGREIGLQYVHAHIRYIEAMAKIGKNDLAYKGLFEINPILIKKAVSNASYRQSNVYFSSSDANFSNRYQASLEFERIRKQEIEVKGGWRLYSSGPGIYIKQLICHILGIRIYHHHLVIDPILPDKFDGLEISYQYLGKPLTVKLHKKEGIPLLMNKPFEYLRINNKYRQGGILVDQKLLKHLDHIVIDMYF
jgi:1,2-beta-oligoglucan phosphorylase